MKILAKNWITFLNMMPIEISKSETDTISLYPFCGHVVKSTSSKMFYKTTALKYFSKFLRKPL